MRDTTPQTAAGPSTQELWAAFQRLLSTHEEGKHSHLSLTHPKTWVAAVPLSSYTMTLSSKIPTLKSTWRLKSIILSASPKQKGQERRYVTQLSQKVLLGTPGSFFNHVPRSGSLRCRRDSRGRSLNGRGFPRG